MVHPYFDCLVYISFARFKCLLMVSNLILKLQLLVVLVGLCGGQANIFVSFRDAGVVWDINKALFCFLMSFAFFAWLWWSLSSWLTLSKKLKLISSFL